jgi:three-Cys-motif partner protein
MPKVENKKFFQEQTARSQVKSDLIFKFVMAWIQIMIGVQQKRGERPQMAYVDLFSGPGSYEDGSRSTPLLIIDAVLKKPAFREALKTYFNDSDPVLTESLKQEISSLSDIANLRSAPVYRSDEASIALIDSFRLSTQLPQFFFLDQFGWAVITPAIVRRVFLNKMCDCAFFFRTSRVIAAINNPKAEAALSACFLQS